MQFSNRIVLVFLLLTVSGLQLWCQQAFVRGIVKDSSNAEPLIGVVVTTNAGVGAVTDVTGNFVCKVSFPITINGASYSDSATIVLTVSYTGYVSKTVNLIVKKGEFAPIEVMLSSSSRELGTVVVSAGRYEQKIGEVPVSMEVIKPRLIENKNTTNMETIIDQTPGVNVTDGQANIRGGSGYSFGAGSRVLMVVDDMPMLSGDAGDVKWNYLPVENVSQVEVLKGASSALFGSSALNGVIHFRTAYPGPKPQTTITMFSGLYDNPRRPELRWWGNTNPASNGINFAHSRQIGNLDLTVGGHVFDDDGYRYLETEQRQRMNVNTRYRFQRIPGLSAGINLNGMRTTGGLFILWYSDTLAYTPADSSIQVYKNYRYNIDPYISYYGPKGHRHNLRTRVFVTDNKNDKSQGSLAKLWYGEYQYQVKFKNALTVTSGIVGTYTTVNAEIYGTRDANNISGYAQFDYKFFEKLFVTVGVRGEYFRLDTARSTFSVANGSDTLTLPFRPVGRIGVSYRFAEATYIRGSYGQGYRFPSVAEKYVRTSASGLEIYPNFQLQPEYGQSAEVGIKQGVRISKWKGYADVSAFWMEYTDMMEFSFGQWGSPLVDPSFGLGFKSVNVGKTRILGIDFSLMGQGEIGKVDFIVLGGYTYMNPVSLSFDRAVDTLFATSDENILKYRYRHLAKFDIEASYLKFSLGMSTRYNSFMENIDQFFVSALPSIGAYRAIYNTGDIVFDARFIYRINDKSRIAFICNNILNREYTSRPADVQPPRNFVIQVQVKF